MSVYGPSSAFFIVGGRNLSGDTFQLSESMESIVEEVHGLGDTFEEQVPIELARITLEASGGIYDDRVNGPVEALQAQGNTLQVVTYGFAGTGVGADVVMLNGVFAAIWKRIAQRDGLTKAHAEYVVNSKYNVGNILHGLTAETSDPGNTEATSVDYSTQGPAVSITSSSVANPTTITCPVAHGLTTGNIIVISGHTGSTPSINGQHTVTVTGTNTFTIPVNVTVGGTGGQFVNVTTTNANGAADLHVTALTLGGYTSVTVKVRHSADNITFTDLVTFTTVTAAPFAERKAVTGTVQRYTAISWDFIGAGSGQTFVPYVALSR